MVQQMNGSKARLAFLGPLGTYTHQAAHERFGEDVEYVERKNITDVYNALSSSVHFAVLPSENTIHGAVVESYNALRSETLGRENYVRGQIVIPINHCLVVRTGVKLDDIECVLSHEQALGQCRKFLSEKLPDASLIPTESTAAAARLLLGQRIDGRDSNKCAAICSKVVVAMFEGLMLLCEGVQDIKTNFTRFFVLSRGAEIALPVCSVPSNDRYALLRITDSPQSAANDVKHPTSIAPWLHSIDLPILRMDRRPALSSEPFHDVYFIEVSKRRVEALDAPWWDELRYHVLKKVSDNGGQGQVLGVW